MEPDLVRSIADKLDKGEEVAVVTVISSNLMASGQPGATMIVDQFGQVLGGDIGDSILQEKARREAERLISKGLSRKIMLSNDNKSMEIFIKVFCHKDKLIIVGSGNLVQDIYQIAVVMGYDITIIDNRPETLTRERFPLAGKLLLGDIVELLKSVEIDSNTNIVIISHSHEYDEPALLAVVNSPARYIGVLGNKRKVTAYFSKMSALGVAEELMYRVHVPVGLDLGGQKNAEIALAIMAEIQAVKYNRPGGFLAIKSLEMEKGRYEEFY